MASTTTHLVPKQPPEALKQEQQRVVGIDALDLLEEIAAEPKTLSAGLVDRIRKCLARRHG